MWNGREDFEDWKTIQEAQEVKGKLAETENRIKELEELLEETEDKAEEKGFELENAQDRIKELEEALGDLCNIFKGFKESAYTGYDDPFAEEGAYIRCEKEVKKKMSELGI